MNNRIYKLNKSKIIFNKIKINQYKIKMNSNKMIANLAIINKIYNKI